MTDNDPEVLKNAVKEALREWLDDKYREFGWFSIKAVAAFALAMLVWLWFQGHGWKL